MTNRFFVTAVCVAAAQILASVPVAAQLALVRNTTTTINPGNVANFGDASFVYANQYELPDGPANQNVNFNIVPGATNIQLQGFGGIVVTPGSAPDGTTALFANYSGTGGPGQGLTFGYAGVQQTGSFIQATTYLGSAALFVSGGGVGLVAAGGTFNTQFIILGNWLTRSTAPVFTAGYTSSGFSYDGTFTRLTVSTSNYVTDVNPGVSFYLRGAVPEPASWAMLIAGFGLIGAAARRRRSALTFI